MLYRVFATRCAEVCHYTVISSNEMWSVAALWRHNGDNILLMFSRINSRRGTHSTAPHRASSLAVYHYRNYWRITCHAAMNRRQWFRAQQSINSDKVICRQTLRDRSGSTWWTGGDVQSLVFQRPPHKMHQQYSAPHLTNGQPKAPSQ